MFMNIIREKRFLYRQIETGEHSTHTHVAVVLVRRVLNVKVGDTTGCVLVVHSILHLSKNING